MKYELKNAKQWVRENLQGYIVCTTAPFHDDLSLDEAGVRRNTSHLLGLASTNGLYVNSVFAEHHSLTIAERKRIAEIVVDEVAGRVPVVVEASAESLFDAIDLGQHAGTIGADLVILGAPVHGLRTRQGVLDYFTDFAAATQIGIAVFTTNWADVGFHIDTDMLLKLAELEAVCAVKDATSNLVEFYDKLERVGPIMVVSRPSEQYWLAGRLVMGAELVSPVFLGTTKSIYCDDITNRFLQSVLSENWSDARQQMLRAVRLSAQVFSGHAAGHHEVAATKAVSALFGMAAGPVRPPLEAPGERQLRQAVDALVAAGSLSEAFRAG